MLIEFRVANYRSFRAEQVLSMVASPDKELPNNTFSVPALIRHQLLAAAVVYGHNASGKSNLLKAMQTAARIVVRSARVSPTRELPIQPFRLDPAYGSNLPTRFGFAFVEEGTRYEYDFQLGKRKIHEERLVAWPKGLSRLLFERTWDTSTDDYNWHFGTSYRGERQRLIELTRPNALFLSVAAQFNHKQLTPVFNWFTKIMTLEPNDDRDLEFMAAVELAESNEEDRLAEKLQTLLQVADLGITRVVVEERAVIQDAPDDDLPPEVRDAFKAFFAKLSESTKQDAKRLDISLYHRTISGDDVVFRPEDESRGTMRLMAIGARVLRALEKGGLLIVDELDASMHPVLVRALIQLFLSEASNPHQAQLIFNTHDTTLLDLKLFRRDQIWFVQKDNSGASRVYSLLEYRARKGEALQKGYLEGRYGGIGIVDGIEWSMASHAER